MSVYMMVEEQRDVLPGFIKNMAKLYLNELFFLFLKSLYSHSMCNCNCWSAANHWRHLDCSSAHCRQCNHTTEECLLKRGVMEPLLSNLHNYLHYKHLSLSVSSRYHRLNYILFPWGGDWMCVYSYILFMRNSTTSEWISCRIPYGFGCSGYN